MIIIDSSNAREILLPSLLQYYVLPLLYPLPWKKIPSIQYHAEVEEELHERPEAVLFKHLHIRTGGEGLHPLKY
jgi:hypothetical protein